MEDTTRRSLQELGTVYQLNPQFRDIFVEGREDARFLTFHLEALGVQHLSVRAVGDAVRLSDEEVVAFGCDAGERGRVIALSLAAEGWGVAPQTVTCIVDSDFDALSGPCLAGGGLLRTDFAAMEVYSLEERPLRKFLGGVRKDRVVPSELLEALTGLWRHLFVLRYVLHRDHARALNDGFCRRIKLSGESPQIDLRNEARIVLERCGDGVLAAVEKSCMEQLARIPQEGLQGIRGHDIAPVLTWYLRLRGEFKSTEVVESLLRQSIESSDVMSKPLFVALAARYGSQQQLIP